MIKKLPHWLLATFLLILFTACGPAKDKIRITGKFTNINDAEFYVYSEDGAFDGIDTIKISDGKFSYERTLAHPAVLTLLYPNFTQTYVVAEPGHEIKSRAKPQKLASQKLQAPSKTNFSPTSA